MDCLWEIQKSNITKGETPAISDYFRIQHVITGQYMALSLDGTLYLTKNGILQDTLFKFKVNVGNAESIPYDQVA